MKKDAAENPSSNRQHTDSIAEPVVNVATPRSVDLGQLHVNQLLHRLREVEAYEMADRIEYLVSFDAAEDGGDIPTIASIDSFVAFYFDNRDLGEPRLGTTPNGELQAVWALPDHRRLVAEFLADDTVRYVYRRASRAGLSKLFITGRQPRHRVRILLKTASI